MRTSIASILSALVIAATTGTAMASSQVPSLGSGESAAMADTYSSISQPLDTSSAAHRVDVKGLPAEDNGHSTAMAETFANINQPLERTAYSSVAQANGAQQQAGWAFAGRTGHSEAMEDALANANQLFHAGAGASHEQVAVN